MPENILTHGAWLAKAQCASLMIQHRRIYDYVDDYVSQMCSACSALSTAQFTTTPLKLPIVPTLLESPVKSQVPYEGAGRPTDPQAAPDKLPEESTS